MEKIDAIKKAPTENQKARLRTEFGLKETYNPIFLLSVDPYRYLMNRMMSLSPNSACVFRATPIESLHTILLGPYKYLLKDLISSLNKSEKSKFLALVNAFDYTGLDVKITGNIIYHHKSFVGRDYKAWAQMALFVVSHFIPEAQKNMWLYLSKVFVVYYSVSITFL